MLAETAFGGNFCEKNDMKKVLWSTVESKGCYVVMEILLLLKDEADVSRVIHRLLFIDIQKPPCTQGGFY